MPTPSNKEKNDAEDELVELLMSEPNFQGAFMGGPALLTREVVEDMFNNPEAWEADMVKLREWRQGVRK